MADNILEVKKLKISFRTNNGTVKAIRDISFDLKRGETLAIVGESGSGKSVTSKAILGISAGNAIIDSGEILYDGKDLLKLSEEEMYKIRGDKISMIFQDPLSSLNPIVKIESETDLQDESPALTIYIKRDTNVEAQRESLRRVTDISVDKLYTVALSNASKVVLAKFKK